MLLPKIKSYIPIASSKIKRLQLRGQKQKQLNNASVIYLNKNQVLENLEKKSNEASLLIEDDKHYLNIEGYASVFHVEDSYKDIIMPGAFTESLKEYKSGKVKFLWQHDYNFPIGVIDLLYEDKHGLFLKGRILKNIAKGKEACELILNKAINGLSIGFVVKDYSYNQAGRRLISAIDLHEVSIVTFPANSMSTINQAKSQKLENVSLEDAFEKAFISLSEMSNLLN